MLKDRLRYEDGSSPLTRGKRRKMGHGDAARGLIPAHAGKTLHDARRMGPPRAHPRSRGENAETSCSLTTAVGSSPLTRGKHREAASRKKRERLIPAHAGKTLVERE